MGVAPWTDEQFLKGVRVVPDFEPEPDSRHYDTLVLLGPAPLKPWELLCAFGVVSLCLASACSVVALLWWLAKLL